VGDAFASRTRFMPPSLANGPRAAFLARGPIFEAGYGFGIRRLGSPKNMNPSTTS